MPAVVRKIEEDQLRRRHREVLGQQPRIADRPDAAVRRIEPEAAAVLAPEDVAALLGIIRLPRMVGGRQRDGDVPDRKARPDRMARPRQPHFGKQAADILRAVVGGAARAECRAGFAAEMVAVRMRDEHGVERRHRFRPDRRRHEQRHVEAPQHRVDHHRRAAAVDQRAGIAEPAHRRPGFRAERLRAEGHRFRCARLLLLHGPSSLLRACRSAF